ncbi:hypothetical protein EYV94_05420 [Puteibacter caeruleilacunae]|nr:hypothetical protein EYV94_05420 [Puteibacter caeruleilacunae]
MKRLLLLSAVAVLFFGACNNQSKNTVQAKEVKKEEVAAKIENPVSIAKVMEMAESNIGKEVCFKGTVSHVCAHSGRRAILIDETGKMSLRVEATGKLKGFNRELAGVNLAIRGTIQEKRLSEEFINQWEEKTKAKDKDREEGGKHCSAELANITKMRDWMTANNKNYYSIYFINGTDYEVLD